MICNEEYFVLTYSDFINNILHTRGRNGCGDVYHETHHVVPKCMGGLNEKENLIDLFAEEHFYAHKLLALENPNNDALQRAFSTMAHVHKGGRIYNVDEDDYAYIRNQNANRLKEQWKNPEYKENMVVMLTELWQDPLFREKATASWNNEDRRREQSKLMKSLNNNPDVVRKKVDALHKWCDKAVQQINDIGEVIAEFPSGTEASRQTGIPQTSINRCCNNKQKTAGGYSWKFITSF